MSIKSFVLTRCNRQTVCVGSVNRDIVCLFALFTAIRSLEGLSTQIAQFFSTNTAVGDSIPPQSGGGSCAPPSVTWVDHATLTRSMVQMRALLVEAQSQFVRMADENRRMAERIEGDIRSASVEVDLVRAELAETYQALQAEMDNNNCGSRHQTNGSYSSTFLGHLGGPRCHRCLESWGIRDLCGPCPTFSFCLSSSDLKGYLCTK